MQDLIRQIPAVVYEYAFFPGGEQKFTFVSEQSSDILGIEARQLMADARLLKTKVHEDDYTQLQVAFSKEGANDRSAFGFVVLRMQGGGKKIEIRYRDQYAADGSVLRKGLIQDAISRVPTETEPYPYEEVFDRLPIAVVIHHFGTVLFANRHAHHLVGANPRQLIGMKATDFVHPEYVASITDRINQVVAGAPAPLVEQKFVRLDGGVIDVETIAFPFVYTGLPAVQVIFRDITEKKRTEAQVRKNETFFTQLFQSIPMAVVMLDETGKVSEVNRGFEQMFGYSREELRGQNLNDFIVPEDLRSEGIDLNNLITSNQVVSIESIRRHRSGKRINVILYGVPVMLDNQAIGIYGVYVDITGRKQVEEELKVRNAELDNFVYKVSHDLRAPLSSVLGLVNLSRLEGNTDNPQEYISLIGEKIQALDHFIGDVLSHSKNLKMELTVGKVDLYKIIEQTFTDLSYLKGARETQRVVRIEGIDFYSDHWRISEIFRNLISNAIKYARTDSGDSQIIIKITVDHLCADITFADNGIGIKESSLKRIFEMFYRATEQGDGSGIGLYIVKNAVEKLGGEIRVASRPREGTRFHILLPNRINSILSTPSNVE
ncbi:MAG TPA: PAS domain-containing sensor histidine kinase [Chryseosolibacter sp.]|nr:PAS domain-containing sensor histidine kinase [Chryseosolibacter sp.]